MASVSASAGSVARIDVVGRVGLTPGDGSRDMRQMITKQIVVTSSAEPERARWRVAGVGPRDN